MAPAPPVPEVLIWCNGGHYHAPGPCPWSGACNPSALRSVEASRAARVIDGYGALLEAGLSEPEVLELLLVDERVAGIAEANECGSAVDSAVADAVAERNAFLLRQLPRGVLRQQLAESAAAPRCLYARRAGGSWWYLIDPSHLDRWRDAAGIVGGSTRRALRRYLEAELGAPWQEIEHATRARESGAPIDVRPMQMAVLIADDTLCRAHEDAERLREERYPIIPPGHLSFARR